MLIKINELETQNFRWIWKCLNSSYLINPSGIMKKSMRLFHPDIAALILAIPLQRTNISDHQVWQFSKDGKYQVKSGYKIAKMLKDGLLNLASSSTPCRLWKWIWSLKVPPKI